MVFAAHINCFDLWFFKIGDEHVPRVYRDCPYAFGGVDGEDDLLPYLADGDEWFMLKKESSASEQITDHGGEIEYIDYDSDDKTIKHIPIWNRWSGIDLEGEDY